VGILTPNRLLYVLKKRKREVRRAALGQERDQGIVLHFGQRSTRAKPAAIVALARLLVRPGELQSRGNGILCGAADVPPITKATS
jgi:hypothetical protein